MSSFWEGAACSHQQTSRVYRPSRSILLLHHGLQPAWRHLLLQAGISPSWRAPLLSLLTTSYQLLWLLPAYVVTFLVNCIWYACVRGIPCGVLIVDTLIAPRYQDIATMASSVHNNKQTTPRAAVSEDVLTRVSAEVYRTVLFLVFCLQVEGSAWIPIIGASPVMHLITCSHAPHHLHPLAVTGWAMRPCLLAWLYAFYCFDYRWGALGVPVQRRLRLFETDWPFYLGAKHVSSGP